jgi:hypothetical protein
MTFHELDTVVLTRDLPDAGLKQGDLGAVVCVHSSDALDVEFVKGSGRTQALLKLRATDVRTLGDDEILSARNTR